MTKLIISMVLVGAATFVRPASAQVELFNVIWSGAPHGNAASAAATIGINTSAIPNPGVYSDSGTMPSWVSSLTLTVTGSSAGNGTFGLSDFVGVAWNTNGGTLNFATELVGQPTANLPWGTETATPFAAGDFNLFDASGGANAPSGVFFFQLRTNSGTGDVMNLVSFAPVPEPGTCALLGLGAVGLLALRRVRK